MIENFNLIEMIETMEPRQSEDNVNLIINFSRQINSAMKDVEGIGYLKTAFENRMDEFRDYGLQRFSTVLLNAYYGNIQRGYRLPMVNTI